MSEKQKFGMRENIDAQKSLLDTIKTVNAYDMDKLLGEESESIAEKVRAKRGISAGEVAHLAVSIGKIEDDSGKDAGERIWVQTAIPDSNNPNTTSYSYTPVASVFEGAVLPENGFVNEEAMVVSGMAEGLKETKRIGALTHLDPNLTSIQDPTTSLMLLPQVEASPKK